MLLRSQFRPLNFRFYPHFAIYTILPSMHIYNQARLVSNLHCLIFQDRPVIASNFKANLLKCQGKCLGLRCLHKSQSIDKEWKNGVCQQRSDAHFLLSTVTSNRSFHTFINKGDSLLSTIYYFDNYNPFINNTDPDSLSVMRTCMRNKSTP